MFESERHLNDIYSSSTTWFGSLKMRVHLFFPTTPGPGFPSRYKYLQYVSYCGKCTNFLIHSDRFQGQGNVLQLKEI
jgi:hypothetical protein